MLMGYRGEVPKIYEWNWIPEEIICINETSNIKYYPKYNLINNDNNKIFEVQDKAFVYFKDIDFVNKHCIVQISIYNKHNLDIDNLVRESIDYAFNTLQLNKIYGYISSNQKLLVDILKKFNFIKEGIIPNHLYWNNEVYTREIWALIRYDSYDN